VDGFRSQRTRPRGNFRILSASQQLAPATDKEREHAMPHDVTDQVHWHEPSGDKKAGFGKFGRPATPYDKFMESDGIPVFRDIGVSKVQNLPLLPWKRMGGRGTYIQLFGTEGKWGCYVVEVPGSGALNAEKHLYEEIYYVVEGRGTTEVWLEGESKRHIFEWQQGSLFSIPVNAMHRVVNATSSPALLLGGTTAPNLMNLINNVGAIFESSYQFRDRFSGADNFYKPNDDIEPDPVRGLAMRRSNFLPDIVNCDLPLDNRRSPGYRRIEPFMTGNSFYLWVGQHESGRYSKAHAHTSAAILICVKGKGYTYTWPERLGTTPWKDGHADKVRRLDYEPVGLVTAAPGGARWFHQHFSASKEPFRLTAWFGPHSPGREPGPPGEPHTDYTAMDIPDGGSAIPYWMEDPFIRAEYQETLARAGVENRMDPDWYKPGAKVGSVAD
jgi:quercetin dioxygenase-like cupin family protein